ncbi:MAG TPA: response regulator [Clostridia bacterium]|nr:response regulator [Clostridia bacterium]
MASDVHVLLVDDNPVVLDMLRNALEPLARVTPVGDAEQALAVAANNAPDLLITDFQMTPMNGRELVQQVRSRPALSRLPVIMMASKADQNEKLGMMRDAVEDFVEKPFFLRDAVSRIKRVVDKIALEKMTRDSAGEGIVRGTLVQMNAIDLLQSLELGRKSCKLTVTNGNDQCEMYFRDGLVTHAVFGAVIGDTAVYKTLMWEEGSWEIDFTASSSMQTTTRSTQGLLMEGLRLVDEANRDAAEDNVLDG